MRAKKIGQTLVMAGALFAMTGCGFVQVEPLTQQQRADYIAQDRALRQDYLIPVDGPVTLYDAMARAMLANIDYRVQVMEQAVAQSEFEKAKLNMLPELRATGSYTYRDPQGASISENVETGEISTGGYTTSESQERLLGDVTFSWNLLDFGLSYYQAKQQADAVMVRHQMQRKAMQTLLHKVRHAYWKAVFAQTFAPRVDEIILETEQALDHLRAVEGRRLQPLLQTLRFQRTLLGIISQMKSLKSELAMSRIELLNLIDLPFDTEITLVAPGNPNEDRLNPDQLPDIQDMIEVALDQRPETQQAMYRSRASVYEVRKAALKMLPGLELKAAFNYDSNEFLKDDAWGNVWVHLTGNIMDVLTGPMRIEHAKNSVQLAEYRRLATHLAVISQVQIAVLQYKDAVIANNQAKEVSSVEGRIAELVSNEVKSEATSPLESIRHKGSALYSQLNHYKRFADAQNAYSRLMTSIGLDLLPMDMAQTMDFLELRENIEQVQQSQLIDLSDYLQSHILRISALQLASDKEEDGVAEVFEKPVAQVKE